LSRYAYAAVAWFFALGILMQVFLVGLSLLGQQPSWQIHMGLGHALGILALLLVVLAYVGALPYPFKRLTWLTFALYVLLADVVIFLRDTAPIVAALHPVLAVTLFAVTSSLALRATRLVRRLPVGEQPTPAPIGQVDRRGYSPSVGGETA
jgi:hypothetical protein